MAILLPSSYLKVAVVSTGVLSIAAAAATFSAPFVSHFAVSFFPIVYENVVFFLRPPYLYLVINCIIISIFASCKLQQKQSSGGDPYFSEAEAPLPVPSNVSTYLRTDYVTAYDGLAENSLRDDARDDRVVETAQRFPEVIAEKITTDGGDERRKTEKPKARSDSTEFSMSKEAEKPPASARFGQRKAVKVGSEGRNKTAALGVSRPRRQDTLETTWKKITEGRSMPLTRQLKKSDTWENESSHVRGSEKEQHRQRMTKSENLDDGNTAAGGEQPRRSGRLMREPSPGQEELNRRVEAFIKKFNEEMRLQRLESLAKYHGMINSRAL